MLMLSSCPAADGTRGLSLPALLLLLLPSLALPGGGVGDPLSHHYRQSVIGCYTEHRPLGSQQEAHWAKQLLTGNKIEQSLVGYRAPVMRMLTVALHESYSPQHCCRVPMQPPSLDGSRHDWHCVTVQIQHAEEGTQQLLGCPHVVA
jgi:hypothetical protein